MISIDCKELNDKTRQVVVSVSRTYPGPRLIAAAPPALPDPDLHNVNVSKIHKVLPKVAL